ncbi:MAG: hypothetical protein IIB58_09230, partial [Planctomycetes bacterium]|nr:hypothetical protein [Planctomycetota bacterium]
MEQNKKALERLAFFMIFMFVGCRWFCPVLMPRVLGLKRIHGFKKCLVGY